ncbi:MAG: sulfatase [Candidatus Solibacter usitatus]|nr:sulfatase [Candidatus Solibacter usitatus]
MGATRREFLAAPALLAAEKRPNILLLLADNWAYPHAGSCGDAVVRTPVFDKLAREGVLFKNAFAPNPSCSPSRSSLLCGQETHRLREAASLYGNLSPQFPSYPRLLESAGYHTGFAGKGWGPGSPEKSGYKQNPAGKSFQDFAAFLKARPPGAPFCFWFGSHDPHVPWNRGQERRSSLDASKIRVPGHLPDQAPVREDIRNYYCEVEQFDFECGEIIDALRRSGELDQTLVLMTSDNGWQMPRGLANCYDLGVRIPMAMRLPGVLPARSIRQDFVSIADLMPTFLEAAGHAIPKGVTARSLLKPGNREWMFVERERHANVRRGNLSYPVRGIRTRNFLYLRNLEPDRWPAGDPELYWAVGPYGDIDDSLTKRLLMEQKPQPYFDLCMGKRPGEELYDLRADPWQVRNVAGEAAFAATKRELSARVTAWMKATGDPRAAGSTDIWDKAPYIGPPKKK